MLNTYGVSLRSKNLLSTKIDSYTPQGEIVLVATLQLTVTADQLRSYGRSLGLEERRHCYARFD